MQSTKVKKRKQYLRFQLLTFTFYFAKTKINFQQGHKFKDLQKNVCFAHTKVKLEVEAWKYANELCMVLKHLQTATQVYMMLTPFTFCLSLPHTRHFKLIHTTHRTKDGNPSMCSLLS